MPQIFSPGATTAARLVLVSLVGLPVMIISGAYVVTSSSNVTRQGQAVEQWPPFSHEHHAGQLGIACRYCHTGVEKSAFAGLPPTHTCMTCHSQIWTNAEMLAPVRVSLAEGKPLAWTRVNDLPDYVFFDHSVHVNHGVGCSSCHGRVDRMPLTVKAAPMTMGWCLSCHRDPAPQLRPPDAVAAMDWTPPPDQEAEGRRLLQAYAIRLDHLTDCSTCHR